MTGLRGPRLWERVDIHPLALIAVPALVLGALVYVGRWLTFWYDEWTIILDRSTPSLQSLLAPHVDHLSIVPVAIYQVMLPVFGMASYWPYLALVWTSHFATCALLFRVVRRRTASRFIATIGCISLLTLGAAFEDVLQVFQVSFLISTVFGLVAIDRLSLKVVRRREIAIASVSLAIAVGSSSVGVVCMGLLILWSILSRRRDVLISAVPVVVLYAAWYLAWGRGGEGPIGDPLADPFTTLATFGFGLGASVVALTGQPPYKFAPIGLIIGAALLIRGFMIGRSPGALGLAALGALAAEYALQAWFRSGFGIEYAARSGYLYPAAIFIWVAIADALRGVGDVGVPRWARIVVVVALALAIVGNGLQFLGAGRAMRALRVDELAELRLIETLRADPRLARDVSPDPELIPQVTADRYLVAIDRFGSPRLWIEEGDPSVVATEADQARVNGASLRLLADAFIVGGPTVTVHSTTMITINPQASVIELSDACLQVSSPTSSEALWSVAPGTGVRIDGDGHQVSSLDLGIRPEGLTTVGDDLMAAVVGGEAVIPPSLQGDSTWHARLILRPGTTVICIVTSGT